MKKTLLTAAAAFAMTASAAFATTVTNLGDGADAYALIDPTAGTDLAAGLTFDATVVAGDVRNLNRSPYDFSGNAGVAGYETLEYFAVGPGHPTSPATLTISGGANTLNLLWGSIDDHNSIELWSGGVLLDTITDADLTPSSTEPAARGASYISIFSADQFDTVIFGATRNAFEFGNVSVSAVPLPASGIFLLAALGGMGFVSRRKAA